VLMVSLKSLLKKWWKNNE